MAWREAFVSLVPAVVRQSESAGATDAGQKLVSWLKEVCQLDWLLQALERNVPSGKGIVTSLSGRVVMFAPAVGDREW